MIIGAVILARNMEPTIGATIASLSWVNGIYLYDDSSSDRTIAVAQKSANTRLVVERSSGAVPAFSRGECAVRNFTIDQAFAALDCDVLVSVDADELVAASLRGHITKTIGSGCARISLSMWHLFDRSRYLHFWEQNLGGSSVIDPHTRVFTRGTYFQDIFADGSHPAIVAQEDTLFLHEGFHFHLKYFHLSPYVNERLDFLPRRIDKDSAAPYLRHLPFTLPVDICAAINGIGWAA
jgi:glycosyltransferase involved in cell wall biosynthesis